jgi:hypothetical protein
MDKDTPCPCAGKPFAGFDPYSQRDLGALPPLQPFAVRAEEASRLISVGLRHFRAMDSAGRVPRGFYLGRIKLWRVADLFEFVRLGFPTREQFERLRAESQR